MEVRVPNNLRKEYEDFCDKRKAKVGKQHADDVVLEIENLNLTDSQINITTLRGEGGKTGVGSLRIEYGGSSGKKETPVLPQVLCQSGENTWHSAIRSVYAISKDKKSVLFVGFVMEHEGPKPAENYKKLKRIATKVTQKQLEEDYYRPLDEIGCRDAENITKLSIEELLFLVMEKQKERDAERDADKKAKKEAQLKEFVRIQVSGGLTDEEKDELCALGYNKKDKQIAMAAAYIFGTAEDPINGKPRGGGMGGR